MKRLRISPQAIARTLLSKLDNHKPLTKAEAAKIQLALDNTGIDDAATRLNAGWSRVLLKRIA